MAPSFFLFGATVCPTLWLCSVQCSHKGFSSKLEYFARKRGYCEENVLGFSSWAASATLANMSGAAASAPLVQYVVVRKDLIKSLSWSTGR